MIGVRLRYQTLNRSVNMFDYCVKMNVNSI